MTDDRIAAIRERCEREKVIEATGRKANGVYLDTVPFLLTEIDRLQSEQAARIDPKPLTLDELPAADVVPVVRGEWVIIDDGVLIGNGKHVECSNCGAWSGQSEKPPYCKHCGADMREDKP